jgi:hypothetical protein
MKSVIAGFLTTAVLMALHVAPSPEALRPYASAADQAFAERHRNESKDAIRAELGLDH